jgi:transposase
VIAVELARATARAAAAIAVPAGKGKRAGQPVHPRHISVHADETSWQVFGDVEDKDGHRWWLWVFVTSETTVFVMDTSRSADVAAGQLSIDREQTALEAGRRLVISSDFHKAYQSLACIDGVDPLWCWAQYAAVFPAGRGRAPRGAWRLVRRVD